MVTEVDPVQQAIEITKDRVLKYLKEPTGGRMFVDLLPVSGLRRGCFIEGTSEYRVLDRALQQLRKTGKIEFDAQGWKLSDSGWTLEGIHEANKVPKKKKKT